jgi:Ca-activated chloride channel homolog
VSFEAPLFLIALALVPLGIVLYGRAERRRRRAAAAFAAPAVAASATPRRPGWRRHAPLALAGIALAVLILALARPQATVAVPVEQASVVLALDHSGSMQATDVSPSRLAAVREAADAFLDRVPEDVRVGAVAFDHRARAVASPSTDREELRDGLEQALKPSGGTATGDAMQTALSMLNHRANKRPPSAIVLLSDGVSTSGRDPMEVADTARKAKVPVHTVALGTESGTITTPDGSTQRVPPDIDTLREIAERTGGKAFRTADASELSAVYEELGSKVATKDEKREVTAGFAAGALAFLLVGIALSLRWFRRLL